MDRRYARLILNIVIPVVEILLLCLLGPKLLKFFMPFVIGWIIAMIANPLVRFLESRVKLVRKHSSVLIVVAVLALIIGLSYFLVSRLILQAMELTKDLPVLYDMVSADLREISTRFASLFSRLPEQVQTNWQELAGNIGHAASLLCTENCISDGRSSRKCSKRNPERTGQCSCDNSFVLLFYCGAG